MFIINHFPLYFFSLFFRESSLGRLNQINENIRVDAMYGFHTVTDIKERIGFLINMHIVINACYIIV